jgi:DNA-binding response OmpR family regulator
MKNILIVAYDRSAASALDEGFRAEGFGTRVAEDEVHALRMSVADPPDLILIEISPAEVTGLELAKRLRAHAATCNVPLVLLASEEEPQVLQTSMELNVIALFRKPYNFRQIISAAHNALAAASVHERLFPAKRRAQRILIIEDDPRIGMAVSLRLKAAGCQTEIAFDALLGLQAALRRRPDVVVLDISIPAGNGFQVAEKLQMLMDEPPPVVFLTASKQPDFRQRARQLGAAGFLEKPYEAEELLSAISRALGPESPTLIATE